jgi:hypothetical protein
MHFVFEMAAHLRERLEASQETEIFDEYSHCRRDLFGTQESGKFSFRLPGVLSSTATNSLETFFALLPLVRFSKRDVAHETPVVTGITSPA